MDESDFERLFRTYYTRLAAFVFRVVGDHDVAEDMATDAYAVLWARRDTAGDESHARRLLYRTVENAALTRVRDERTQLRLLSTSPVLLSAALSHSDEQQARDLDAIVRSAIAEMPPQRRAVYALCYEQSLTSAEVSDFLDVSVKAIEKHMSVALATLRAVLASHVTNPKTSPSAVDQLLHSAATHVNERFEVGRGRAILAQKISSGGIEIAASGKVLQASRQTIQARAATHASARAASRRRWRWGFVIGCVLCLAGGIVALRHRHRKAGTTMPSVAPNRVYEVALGERTNVTLADGSIVWLNSGSRLTVPADFGEHARTVAMEGHILFEVTHNPKSPFIVHAANTTTTVLGTSFVVRAYRGDPIVTVAVREGSVVVHAGQAAGTTGTAVTKDAVLHAGDIVHVDDRDDSIERVGDDDLASLTAFSVNRLTFHRTPIAQAVADIGRWYDVDVQLTPSVSRRTQITGTFTNATLSSVVMTVAQSAGVPYHITGRRVTFGRGS